MDEAVNADLRARLEALAARVNEQEAEIRQIKQAARISTPISMTSEESAERAIEQSDPDKSLLSRRDLLTKGAAGLTVAALAAARAPAAEAGARTTVFAEAAASYGLGATYPAGTDPAGFLPPLGSTVHAVIGSSVNSAPSPVGSAGVTGCGSGNWGVQGMSSSGMGVYGQSASGNGVRGVIPETSSSNAIAIYGQNSSSFAGPGPGAGGFGVYGLSAKGHGLVGATAATGAAAVVGATNGVAGAWAAAFYGPVIVGGDFIVAGGAKSAAVPHPDGSHRQLYCVESPESWFEDFGTAQLVEGRANVTIDPAFAAVADTDQYHVFLTAYNADHLLHVSNRAPTNFTVEANAALAALQGRESCDLSGTFSWRVVAKRKDIVGERLAKVTLPPEPVLPTTELVIPTSSDR